MKIKYKKFLAISTIFIILGVVYLYISNDVKSDNDLVKVALGSSLSSTRTGIVDSPSLSNDINSDIAFLATLVSLKTINIDTTIFSNKSFNSLVNNAVKIEPVTPGRSNPFSPINNSNNITSTSSVVTDQPTQITSTSVTLNGTVNITNGVTDVYFKYGTTESLTTTTTKVEQSLVGTFIKNITGLISKTNYFFKACAKINGVENCGEIVSFLTQ